MCYYKISDPVKYSLNTNLSKEILRALFSCEVHALIAGYELDSIITTKRGDVEKELYELLTENVKKLDIGVDIMRVHMQEAHPPVNVVPEYRAVASAREKKSEIIHKANAYANDLIPKSKGLADSLFFEAEGYAIEKVKIAEGESNAFNNQQNRYSRYATVNKERLWWENIEKTFKNKTIYILPSKAEKRVFRTED